MLYRLLNLQGPEAFFQIRVVVDVLKGIGAHLRVTTRTLEEMRTSLRVNADRIRQYPIASRALAQLAAEATSEKDFVSLYWAEYARAGTSVEDFAARIRNLDELVATHGVEVDEERHEHVLSDPSWQEEQGLVYLAAEHVHPGGRPPHEGMVAHDAFHRLLVLQMRGGSTSFARARAWLLTCDGKLSLYDRFANRGRRSGAPYCIYPDQCLQMTRWALPRTVDYDRAFVELVCSPYVATVVDLPSEASHLICARIDQYTTERSLGEETATRMALLTLVDRKVAADFREAAPPDSRFPDIDEAIARSLEALERHSHDAEHAAVLAPIRFT